MSLTEWQGSGTIYLQRRFVYGPGLDEPLASIDGPNVRTYQFTDALGSVIGLANASGQLTAKYAYTAYGTGVVTGSGTAAYRFAGRLLDGETGLYHNRARAYSPVLGRFMQADPIGTEGGINLYAYVGNNPVNQTDPSGLISWGEYAQRGIRVVNAALSGSVHPVTGIPFKNGFPDFSDVAAKTVNVNKITGNRRTDEIAANLAAGLDGTPSGYTWHHAETGEAGIASMTMQLVPTGIHSATAHTGTAAYARAIGGLIKDIATDPTTYMSVGIGTFLQVMSPSPAGAGEDQILQQQRSKAGHSK